MNKKERIISSIIYKSEDKNENAPHKKLDNINYSNNHGEIGDVFFSYEKLDTPDYKDIYMTQIIDAHREFYYCDFFNSQKENNKTYTTYELKNMDLKTTYEIDHECSNLSIFKEKWLNIVSDLDKKVTVDDACNISLYIMIHFHKKNYLSLENNIELIDIKKIPRTSMVAILRYTRIAQEKIGNWFIFRDKCVAELNERGENPLSILRDLLNDK